MGAGGTFTFTFNAGCLSLLVHVDCFRAPWGSQDSPRALGSTEERGEGCAYCPGSQDSERQAGSFPTLLLSLGPTLRSLVLSTGVATIHISLLPFLYCLSTRISFPEAWHSEEHCPQHLRGASEPQLGAGRIHLWAQLVGNTLSPARMEEVPEAEVKEADWDMEGGPEGTGLSGP